MTVLFAVVALLFSAKILWNLTVPYALAAKAYRGSWTGGISLMPMVEIALLLVALVLSFVRRRPWPWSVEGVALLGAVMVVGSYVHLVVAGGLAGWIAQRLRR